MKKILGLVGLTALVSGGASIGFSACAPTDMVCYETGSQASPTVQARVDASGNLTLNGGITSAGTNAITGSLTTTGNVTISGKTIYAPQSVVNISSFTTIVPTGTYLTVVSTANGTTSVSCGAAANTPVTNVTPCISTTTATNGQILVIASTSTNSTVTFMDTINSGMNLGGNRLIDQKNTLTVIFDSVNSIWKELSYGSN